MNNPRPILRSLVAAAAVGAAVFGCRPNNPPEPSAAPVQKIEVRKSEPRQFDTMVFRASVTRQHTKEGKLVHHSTDTLTVTIDAVNNLSRLELKSSYPGESELQIFDGKRFWTLEAKEKTFYGYDMPWPDYKVWEQIPAAQQSVSERESLRGVETTVYKDQRGTFWYYKGVLVQFDKKGKTTRTRSSLRELKENVTLPPDTFKLPEEYTKIGY